MTPPTPLDAPERVPRATRYRSRRTRVTLATICLLAALGVMGREWLSVTARVRQPASASSGATDAAAGRPSGDTRTLKVGFSWAANTEGDLAGYVVSWGDKPGAYTQSKTLGRESTSVELELARRPEPYFVAVQARNAAGQVSGYSNEFSLDVSSGKAKALKGGKSATPKTKRVKPPKEKKPKKPKKTKAQKTTP